MLNKKSPLRTCVGCRGSKDKKELIRVVKTPEGEIKLDFTGKLNGRGAYVCNKRECLEKLIKNKQLNRSFKCNITQEFYDKLKEEFLEANK